MEPEKKQSRWKSFSTKPWSDLDNHDAGIEEFSEADLEILRSAAKILHCPVSNLLAAKDTGVSRPDTATFDVTGAQEPPNAMQHECEPQEPHNSSQWPSHGISSGLGASHYAYSHVGLQFPTETSPGDANLEILTYTPREPHSLLGYQNVILDGDMGTDITFMQPVTGSVVEDFNEIGDVFDQGGFDWTLSHQELHIFPSNEVQFSVGSQSSSDSSSSNAVVSAADTDEARPSVEPITYSSDQERTSLECDTDDNLSNSDSSWIFTTPPGSDVHSQSDIRSCSQESTFSALVSTDTRSQDFMSFEFGDDDVNFSPQESSAQAIASNGPCTFVWDLPPRKRRGRKRRPRESQHQTSALQSGHNSQKRRRGAFHNQQARENTALTRLLNACVRCRMQRSRCEPDLENPQNPCLSCQRLSRSPLMILPCLRYKIADASLFREQSRPNPFWTQRWKAMVIQDITVWASPEIKTIELTQGFGDAVFKLEVREFVPMEGDMLEKFWNDGMIRRGHKITPYAIVDMEKAGNDLRQYMNDNVAAYIVGVVGLTDPLLWNTYFVAHKHSGEAPTEEERSLLRNTLRLWVAARWTSNPERICGEETLGNTPGDNPSSPYFNRIPIAPVIAAQLEVIVYSKVLRPLSKAVLEQLQRLFSANKKKYWFTIYLTLFLLLHSCSMITKRDEQHARKMVLKTQFANEESIRAHHTGALTMLAHFHYVSKGKLPFNLSLEPDGIQELAETSELSKEQATLICQTALSIMQRQADIKQAKENHIFGHDLYFLSQLFEDDWTPGPTA